MKNMLRKTLAVLAFSALIAIPAMAQDVDIGDLQKGGEALSKELAKALPFNSTLGLNWSDAYIGQLLAVPLHFGVGVMGGVTTIDAQEMAGLLEDLGFDAGDMGDSLPLPAVAAEGRVGGFILPFDVGFKVGFIPASVGESLSDAAGGLDVDYLLVGADVRYAVLKGGLVMPKISVGLGFNYMKGGLSTSVGTDQSFTYMTSPSTSATITATAPDVGLEWRTTTLDFKVQASKSLLIITPYIGLGMTYGWSNAGYFVKSTIEDGSGNEISQSDIDSLNDYLEQAGYDPLDIDAGGFSAAHDVSGMAFRAFGGMSVNLFVLKLDLTGLYNFSDGSYGITLGTRFQL